MYAPSAGRTKYELSRSSRSIWTKRVAWIALSLTTPRSWFSIRRAGPRTQVRTSASTVTGAWPADHDDSRTSIRASARAASTNTASPSRTTRRTIAREQMPSVQLGFFVPCKGAPEGGKGAIDRVIMDHAIVPAHGLPGAETGQKPRGTAPRVRICIERDAQVAEIA